MSNKLTKYDKIELIKEFGEFLNFKSEGKKEILEIPLSIFSDKLTPFETVVKFLVENHDLKYSKVGKLLNKDRRVIWTTYKRTIKKYQQKFKILDFKNNIPISKLFSKNCSIAEILVAYLKDELGMKNSEIAQILNRDSRTIWTHYNRYITKEKSKSNE